MKTRITISVLAAGLCLFGGLLQAQVPTTVGSSTPATVTANPPVRVAGGGIFTFEEEVHDFGTLEQGGDATWNFKFTNTGTEDILIETAHGSCGCTVPTWPKEAIKPGETGEIFVKYDSNRLGGIDKNVTIISNASVTDKKIYIKGNIVAKPAAPSFEAPSMGGAPASGH